MALNESQFQCPSDISLIGFDDLIISNLSNPKLTLVVQPLRELADSAAELLLTRMENRELRVVFQGYLRCWFRFTLLVWKLAGYFNAYFQSVCMKENLAGISKPNICSVLFYCLRYSR